MTKKLSLVERVLIDRHQNPDRTSPEIAEALGALRTSVSTSLWTLRQGKMIDAENRITEAGRAAVERLTPAYDAAFEQRLAEFATPRQDRAEKRKAKQRKAPSPRTPEPISALPSPVVASRQEAAHRMADSVIANARTSMVVLRQYLDESVEVSPLLAALLDQCDAGISLIEQTYRVAAR